MQVSLGNVYRAFVKYDANHDNKLTKEEIARAALDLKDQGYYEEFMLFATFLQGGKNGTGLFPDFDNDGAISFAEINQLARADGKFAIISPEDFKAKFPELAGEGNPIDIEALEELANKPPKQVVQLGNVYRIFLEFDQDGDHKLSKQEVAQAALALKERGQFPEFMLFATFIQGGKNGQGLFPDEDHDNKLDFGELDKLAQSHGNPNTITPEDFKAMFPNLAGEGNTINLEKIEKIAYPDGRAAEENALSLFRAIIQFYRNMLYGFFRGFFPFFR